MQNQPKIEAVVWDYGGVLVRTQDWSSRGRWEQRLGLDSLALTKAVFEGETGMQAAVGKATAADVWASVAAELGLSAEEAETLQRDFWGGDRLDDYLMAYIRGLRPTYKTGLITNAWPEVREALERGFRIADAFDEIVISAEVGIVKPNPEIYQLMLGRLNIQAHNSVFVDDFMENVEGARAVGMHAVHFQDTQQALAELQTYFEGNLP